VPFAHLAAAIGGADAKIRVRICRWVSSVPAVYNPRGQQLRAVLLYLPATGGFSSRPLMPTGLVWTF